MTTAPLQHDASRLNDVGRQAVSAAHTAGPGTRQAHAQALAVIAADALDIDELQVLAAVLANELSRWMAAHGELLKAYNALRDEVLQHVAAHGESS